MIPYIVALAALAYYGHQTILAALIAWEIVTVVVYMTFLKDR